MHGHNDHPVFLKSYNDNHSFTTFCRVLPIAFLSKQYLILPKNQQQPSSHDFLPHPSTLRNDDTLQLLTLTQHNTQY